MMAKDRADVEEEAVVIDVTIAGLEGLLLIDVILQVLLEATVMAQYFPINIR